MDKSVKFVETKEQTAIREAIDIIENKRLFGFTRSEKAKLDYAATILRRFLPKPAAIESSHVFCPSCANMQPYDTNDTFWGYCYNCGQYIYNKQDKEAF